MPNEETIRSILRPCARFEVGGAPQDNGASIGGIPRGPAGSVWPCPGGRPLTFIGRFGLAADRWMPGTDRHLSIFINEDEGYIEPGDDAYCTMWLHDEVGEPIAVPEGARLLPERGVTYTEGTDLPHIFDFGLTDAPLDWTDHDDYDVLAKALTGDRSGSSKVGGYPVIYGGGDLGVGSGGGQKRYELIVGLSGSLGVGAQIHDVLNIFWDTQEGRLIADMDR